MESIEKLLHENTDKATSILEEVVRMVKEDKCGTTTMIAMVLSDIAAKSLVAVSESTGDKSEILGSDLAAIILSKINEVSSAINEGVQSSRQIH